MIWNYIQLVLHQEKLTRKQFMFQPTSSQMFKSTQALSKAIKYSILQSLPVVHGGLVLLWFSPEKSTHQSKFISDAEFRISFAWITSVIIHQQKVRDLRIRHLLLGQQAINMCLFTFFPFFGQTTMHLCEIKWDPSLKRKESIQPHPFFLRIFISHGCWLPAQHGRRFGEDNDRL